MIYFILNHNYHYHDFALHYPNLAHEGITIVEIPHILDNHDYDSRLKILRYEQRLKKNILIRSPEILAIKRRINKEVTPREGDICIFYTELELLNVYIANRFYLAGAKVLLIEDGGFATYIPFSTLVSERLTWRESATLLLLRLIYSYWELRYHKVCGFPYRYMQDYKLSAILIYQPVILKRNVPSYLIKRPPQREVEVTPKCAIFLNTYIYKTYQNFDDYIIGLQKVLHFLCENFDSVLFKFHPFEGKSERAEVTSKVLKFHPMVKIILDDKAIEEIIEEYNPEVAASYFSAGSLNLLYQGVEPMFLYHLLPDLQQQPIFIAVTEILLSLGYNFIDESHFPGRSYSSGLSSNYDSLETDNLISHIHGMS